MKILKALLILLILSSCTDNSSCEAERQSIANKYDQIFKNNPNLTYSEVSRLTADMKGKIKKLNCN